MSGSGIRIPDRAVAMDRATVDGAELEYEVKGSGEPVLLIPPGPVAGAFLPLLSEPALTDRYRVIRYHRRGQAGSTPATAPVSFADHASDAAALLAHLGVRRAHVAGHSFGAKHRTSAGPRPSGGRPDGRAAGALDVRGPERRGLPGASGTRARGLRRR